MYIQIQFLLSFENQNYPISKGRNNPIPKIRGTILNGLIPSYPRVMDYALYGYQAVVERIGCPDVLTCHSPLSPCA